MKKEKKIAPLGMSQQNKSCSYEKPEFPGKQFPFRQQCLTLKKTLRTAPFTETSPSVVGSPNPEGPGADRAPRHSLRTQYRKTPDSSSQASVKSKVLVAVSG